MNTTVARAVTRVPAPAGARSRAGRVVRTALLALLAAGAVGGGYLAARVFRAEPAIVPAPIRQKAVSPVVVVGLGSLEPVGTILRIGAPGNPDGSRIAVLHVAENEVVSQGQLLATLDTAARAGAQLKAAEAAVASKRLALRRQALDTKAAIAARAAALERARAELESTGAEYRRQATLAVQQVASQSNLEKRRREFITAEANTHEMAAALERIQTTATGTDGVEVPIDVAVARQELEATVADLATAAANVELGVIRAPADGRILAIKARAGERIGDAGLLEMGDTRRMRAVVEVYQTDVARIHLGQDVRLRGDALPYAVSGVVERIGAAVKRQSVVNNDPATATDARVIEVFVGLDAAASQETANLSRMQVSAEFVP